MIVTTAVLPVTEPAQHALAAAQAIARAEYLLQPVGIPEDPPLPDLAGARDALLEAVDQLVLARDAAGDRFGADFVDGALTQARAGLAWLDRPAIQPPVAEVLAYTLEAGELARHAIDAFEVGPAAA